MRRRTQAQFHYAVKMVKRDENIIRSTRMVEAIAQCDNCKYALEFNITFNGSKSQLMIFRGGQHERDIYVGGGE